jgi:large subunit ribosomal protein L21
MIDVEKLVTEGGRIELDKVYLVADGEKVTLGRPTIDGARVIADVVEESRKAKVIVFKYKPKVRYRIKRGHRQSYTRLDIKEIVVGKRKGK